MNVRELQSQMTSTLQHGRTMTGGCPVCNCESFDRRFVLHSHTVATCTQCRFEYNYQFQGGGDVNGLFNQDYFMVEHQRAFADHVGDYRKDPSYPVYEQRLNQIEELVPQGRLVDVGPGFGTFLRLAKERGWQPCGVDISRFAAEHIKATHDIDVTVANLCEAELGSEPFDAITFWDSIEHVAFPKQDLERAHHLLRPGGVLLVTTDNFDCLVADLASALYRLSFGTVRYPVARVFIDDNLSYFTAASLHRVIAEIGFVDIRMTKMEYPIGKIQLSRLERLALSTIYRLAALSNRQAQLTLIARKDGA